MGDAKPTEAAAATTVARVTSLLKIIVETDCCVPKRIEHSQWKYG